MDDASYRASGIGTVWHRRNVALAALARAQMAYEAADELNAAEGTALADSAPVTAALDAREVALQKAWRAELEYLYTCAGHIDVLRDLSSEAEAEKREQGP